MQWAVSMAPPIWKRSKCSTLNRISGVCVGQWITADWAVVLVWWGRHRQKIGCGETWLLRLCAFKIVISSCTLLNVSIFSSTFEPSTSRWKVTRCPLIVCVFRLLMYHTVLRNVIKLAWSVFTLIDDCVVLRHYEKTDIFLPLYFVYLWRCLISK